MPQLPSPPTTSARLILLCSFAASLIFLCASSYTSADWIVIFKVASTALLAVLGFRVSKRLGIALTFGAIGDLLLDIRHLGSIGREQLFLFGLVAFLCGHLVYIALFLHFRSHSPWTHNVLREFGVIAVLLTLGTLLLLLQSSLGPLFVPVIVYAFALGAMAISSLLAELGTPLAAIGALCFVASDSMLALSKFRAPFPASGPLIWITYYLAQLLIFLGVSRVTLRKRRQ